MNSSAFIVISGISYGTLKKYFKIGAKPLSGYFSYI